MSKKPNRIDLAADHPMHLAGFVHELDVLECFGVSWSTWERDYRTRIPGRTTPNGRWFHRSQLVAWWSVTTSGADAPQSSR